MSLETVGYILMALGLVLFVYGYLKASRRIELEDLPRVTEQERREALRVASRVRLYDWQDSEDFEKGRS